MDFLTSARTSLNFCPLAIPLPKASESERPMTSAARPVPEAEAAASEKLDVVLDMSAMRFSFRLGLGAGAMIGAALLSACTIAPLGNTMSFKPVGKPSRNEDQAIAYCRYDEMKVRRIEPRQFEGTDSYKELLITNTFMIACMRNQGYEITAIGMPYRLP